MNDDWKKHAVIAKLAEAIKAISHDMHFTCEIEIDQALALLQLIKQKLPSRIET